MTCSTLISTPYEAKSTKPTAELAISFCFPPAMKNRLDSLGYTQLPVSNEKYRRTSHVIQGEKIRPNHRTRDYIPDVPLK